jgi:hypothetical protein
MELKSSASGGLSIANARATGGTFELEGNKGVTQKLSFGGAGVGAGFSLSKAKMAFYCQPLPRAGMLYKMPFAGKELSLAELTGGFIMYEVAGHAGLGGNAFIMFFGGLASHFLAGISSLFGTPAAYIPTLIATSNAFICSTGMTITTDVIPIDGGGTVCMGFIGPPSNQ